MQTHATRTIPLTQGQVAIVDAVDYDWLMQWKWQAIKYTKQNGVTFYAKRYDSHASSISSRTGKVYMKFKFKRMHREIALRAGMPFSREYDHANGNGLDNRRENIRPATHGQNNANRKKEPNKTSRFKGVCWHKPLSKWTAQIGVNGKKIHLGVFVSETDAASAYRLAALKHFGEFACFD